MKAYRLNDLPEGVGHEHCQGINCSVCGHSVCTDTIYNGICMDCDSWHAVPEPSWAQPLFDWIDRTFSRKEER